MESRQNRLTTQQWQYISFFLPNKTRGIHDLRAIVDAIFWQLRTGSQWRNLPKEYPKWYSVYYYFRKWKRDNTLEKLNSGLNQLERKRRQKNTTPSVLSIDSQSVKTSSFISEDKGIDGNKKINGRKRHVITDSLGLVWGVVVTGANKHDGAIAKKVVEPLFGYLDRIKKILADQAYKIDFVDWVSSNTIDIEVDISSKPPSTKGFVPINIRWVTERTFGIFNFFRRLGKDYEKTTDSQEAWILWVNFQMILNRFQ